MNSLDDYGPRVCLESPEKAPYPGNELTLMKTANGFARVRETECSGHSRTCAITTMLRAFLLQIIAHGFGDLLRIFSPLPWSGKQPLLSS